MISSPPEFAARAPRPADAEALAELVAALGDRLGVQIEFGVDDIRNDWRTLDLARDAWAWERDGRLAAFADIRSRGEKISADGFVHPDFHGRGLGTAILRTTEARARERGAAKLENGIVAADRAAAALLEANGYRDVRHYYKMAIELEHARAFHAADDEAFADEWDYETEPFEDFVARRLERPGFDPELWTAVWDGDEIAATLIADRRFGGGWIAGLGVRRPWRRRGLGLALLLRSFRQFYERGVRRVALSVDSDNPTGATRLYERAGMHVEREEVLYVKELEP